MKKVLFVTTVPSTLESFLLPFATHFRQKGWHVDAMADGVSKSSKCLQTFDKVWDVKWSRNPLAIQNFLFAPSTIKKLMLQENYDMVHVHTPVAALVTRFALKDFRKRGKCKVIYTAHGFHFHPLGNAIKNFIFVNLEKLGGNWTDYLVTINREDETAAKKHHLLPSDRIRYMPGIGVDLDYYSQNIVTDDDVSKVYHELGITKNNPLFLSIAEFTPRKHHCDVIQALAKLSRPEVHLALAGSGPLMDEMKQLASELGLTNQIHFLGNRSDIPNLIQASLATILVSEQEGLPRSILESLSMRTPVIGSKIRGIEDLLQDNCGLLVNVGNVASIASSMNWIIEHPEEAQIMGNNGKELMKSYDLSQIIQLHEELYEEALF